MRIQYSTFYLSSLLVSCVSAFPLELPSQVLAARTSTLDSPLLIPRGHHDETSDETSLKSRQWTEEINCIATASLSPPWTVSLDITVSGPADNIHKLTEEVKDRVWTLLEVENAAGHVTSKTTGKVTGSKNFGTAVKETESEKQKEREEFEAWQAKLKPALSVINAKVKSKVVNAPGAGLSRGKPKPKSSKQHTPEPEGKTETKG